MWHIYNVALLIVYQKNMKERVCHFSSQMGNIDYLFLLIYSIKFNKIASCWPLNCTLHSVEDTVKVLFLYYTLLDEFNLIFCWAVRRIISGWSVSKIIIIILILRVNISKHKKISIIEVTYETDYISLLHDLAMSAALNFCILSFLL